jgi:hypothetical protein
MTFKQPATTDEVLQQGADISVMFDEDAIISQEVTDTAEGGQILTFALDGAKMTEYTETLLATMKEVGGADVALSISDVNIKETLDAQGNVIDIVMDFSAAMTVAGEEVSASYYMNMANIKLNTLTSLEFPADLESYTDASELGI